MLPALSQSVEWMNGIQFYLTKDVPLQKARVTVANKLKAPTLLDPLTGQVYKITAFDTLPLADYPLIIADENLFA